MLGFFQDIRRRHSIPTKTSRELLEVTRGFLALVLYDHTEAMSFRSLSAGKAAIDLDVKVLSYYLRATVKIAPVDLKIVGGGGQEKSKSP